MDKDEILGLVQKIFVELFELDQAALTLDAKLYEDLDIDSIDAVDLIVRLKDETNIKITQDRYKEIRTIGDIVNMVDDILREDNLVARN